MNRRDFGSMIVGMPLLDLEGRVNAYEVAGKAASLGARLDRLRLCADFVNAAFVSPFGGYLVRGNRDGGESVYYHPVIERYLRDL